VVRKAFGFKERFYCLVVHHDLGDYSGPVPGDTEFEALFGLAFQVFLHLDEFGCRCQYY
jgi:hypothetical protein